MKAAFQSFVAAALLLPLLSPPLCHSADISLTSLTSVTSWEEEQTDNSAASQYAKFNSRGRLGGFRLDMEGYGRFTDLDEETLTGDEDPHRLYVLAVTLTGGDDRSAVTFGRQFITALVGPEMLDGLNIRAEAGKATFNARWGRRADVSGGSEDESILGFGFDYRLKEGMSLTLDYGRTYDEGILTELLAAEWLYSWYRYTKAYVNLNWDLMSRTLHESLIGTRLFFSDRFTAVFELAHNVQVFDSDSIYSVFAADAAYTRSFSLLFTPGRNTRYAWDYAVESYQGSGSGKRYSVSGRWTPGRTRIDAGLSQHAGYGGDLVEISASVSTPVTRSLRAGIGGDFTRTQNDGEDSVSSSLVYVSAALSLGSGTSIDLRAEQCDDEIGEASRSGRLSLKAEF